MANTRDRKEKKDVWNAVTLSLKSRLSTWAAMSSSCGCAYHAVAVAAPEMKKNLAKLCKLRTGDHADILHSGTGHTMRPCSEKDAAMPHKLTTRVLEMSMTALGSPEPAC